MISNIMVRRGAVWHLTFGGESVTVPHAKGLGDIARLIRAGGDEIHALELREAGDRSGDAGATALAGRGCPVTTPPSGPARPWAAASETPFAGSGRSTPGSRPTSSAPSSPAPTAVIGPTAPRGRRRGLNAGLDVAGRSRRQWTALL